MKSSQQYKFVTREREKVALRIYLFLMQRKQILKQKMAFVWLAINKARLADNVISRKYSCEKLKLMLSCYVKLVSVSFSSIS